LASSPEERADVTLVEHVCAWYRPLAWLTSESGRCESKLVRGVDVLGVVGALRPSCGEEDGSPSSSVVCDSLM